MENPRALVYAEFQHKVALVTKETGMLEEPPYECLPHPYTSVMTMQLATCSVSVSYSPESAAIIVPSKQNNFPQTAAGEESPVVETEGQVTPTSPSIVPPYRGMDIPLRTTKPFPKVHPYGDIDALNPFEGDAIHPRYIQPTPSHQNPIPIACAIS